MSDKVEAVELARGTIDNRNQPWLAKKPIEGPTLTRDNLQTPVIGFKKLNVGWMGEKIEHGIRTWMLQALS